MQVNRQMVVRGMLNGLIVLILALNGYVLWHTRAFQPLVVVPSLLSLPLFYLVLFAGWEPWRLRRIARKAGEELVILPHLAWYVHRESRSEVIDVLGTLALTDRALRFDASPFNNGEDIVVALPLAHITHISADAPRRRSGIFLVISLRDGATLTLKLWRRDVQQHWLRALREQAPALR